jgi:hypothetical protein
MRTFAEMTDADPLMFAAQQALLLLKGAMKNAEEALAACDHVVVRIELDHAIAAIDLAEVRLGNAMGCQAKRIHEEDPEDW